MIKRFGEDRAVQLNLVSTALSPDGLMNIETLRIDWFHSVAAAVRFAALHGGKLWLVGTDIGCDWHGCIRRLRSIVPDAMVFALDSAYSEAHEKDALQSGATMYLVAPITQSVWCSLLGVSPQKYQPYDTISHDTPK